MNQPQSQTIESPETSPPKSDGMSSPGGGNTGEGFSSADLNDFYPRESPPSVAKEPFEAGETFTPPKVDPRATEMVNDALLSMAFATLSKIAISLTGFDEMGLDDNEREQLVMLWQPFTPTFSPLTTAIIGTTMIFGSKFLLYAQLSRQRKLRLAAGQQPPEEQKRDAVAIIEQQGGKSDV